MLLLFSPKKYFSSSNIQKNEDVKKSEVTMSQPFEQEFVLCGEFLSLKDPVGPLLKLEGVDDELRLKESVNGFSVGQDDVTDKRNDGSRDDSKKDVDYHQEVRDTEGLKEVEPCQDPEPEAGEAQMLETIERQAQGNTDCMLWGFLTCTPKDQTVEAEEVRAQEAGKQQVKDTPEGKMEETADGVPTDQAAIVKKGTVWNNVTHEDIVEQHVKETENSLLWEFLTCKSQVKEILESHLTDNSGGQVLENVEVREQSTADNFRTDQAEMAETNLFFDFLTCKDLTLDDDPQLRRSAGQVEATKKPNDGAIVEVKQWVKEVAENGKVTQIMKSQSKLASEEKDVAPDPPTSSQLVTKPTYSKLKASVTTAEIRRWAESKDKRQIKVRTILYSVECGMWRIAYQLYDTCYKPLIASMSIVSRVSCFSYSHTHVLLACFSRPSTVFLE
jgi:hypothetical protein